MRKSSLGVEERNWKIKLNKSSRKSKSDNREKME